MGTSFFFSFAPRNLKFCRTWEMIGLKLFRCDFHKDMIRMNYIVSVPILVVGELTCYLEN